MPNTNPYLILALDHRQSLKTLLNPENSDMVQPDDIISWKTTALKSLLPLCTHVLVDPEYGLPALNGIKEHDKEVILSIEKTGYQTLSDGERVSQLKYSVAELKDLGAKMIKFLVYFNPDAKSAQRQLTLINKVSQDCKANSVEFLLELITYSLNDQPKGLESELIVKSAKEVTRAAKYISLLKATYPGHDYCQELTDMISVPWVLLSGGEEFPVYKRHLERAMTGGASGFAAGRALWQEFPKNARDEWPEFFDEVAKKRLEEIVKIAKIAVKGSGRGF